MKILILLTLFSTISFASENLKRFDGAYHLIQGHQVCPNKLDIYSQEWAPGYDWIVLNTGFNNSIPSINKLSDKIFITDDTMYEVRNLGRQNFFSYHYYRATQDLFRGDAYTSTKDSLSVMVEIFNREGWFDNESLTLVKTDVGVQILIHRSTFTDPEFYAECSYAN